jgi:hypothetical protein
LDALTYARTSTVQLLLQPGTFAALPGSHCSTPTWTKPSPHRAGAHVLVHASSLLVLPSSHCSPASRLRLPQLGRHEGALVHAGSLQSATPLSPSSLATSQSSSVAFVSPD